MNLTREEMRGLKKLEKRKQDGEIVIINTDKSSKLCVMKREDYLVLGEAHVGKDRVIEREEVIRRERTLNNHSLSWSKMWGTGRDHGHEDRVRASKVSNSENRAELYLSYKDHKKVPGKTRPIATGNTSNTLALSNSVSSLVESLANAEEEKHEVISTEDLLYNNGEHDEKVKELRMDEKRKILRKMRCRKHVSQEEQEHVKVVLSPQRGPGGLLVSKEPKLGVLAPQEPSMEEEKDGSSEDGRLRMERSVMEKIEEMIEVATWTDMESQNMAKGGGREGGRGKEIP